MSDTLPAPYTLVPTWEQTPDSRTHELRNVWHLMRAGTTVLTITTVRGARPDYATALRESLSFIDSRLVSQPSNTPPNQEVDKETGF